MGHTIPDAVNQTAVPLQLSRGSNGFYRESTEQVVKWASLSITQRTIARLTTERNLLQRQNQEALYGRFVELTSGLCAINASTL